MKFGVNSSESQIFEHLRVLVKNIIRTAEDSKQTFAEVAEQEYDSFVNQLPREIYPPEIRVAVIARGKEFISVLDGIFAQNHLWDSLDSIMERHTPKSAIPETASSYPRVL